jgi:methanesulfonate monooxygenase small subunit
MSTEPHAELRAALEDAVHRSAEYLDGRRFADWLALTAPDFRYRIQAYSPEIRKDMTWLDHDRAGIAALIELLPKHHTTGAEWLRQVVLGTITRHGETEATTVSSFVIFQTAVDVGDSHVDGGSTSVFLAGRYHDRFRLQQGRWLLVDRVARLSTRQLGIGSHYFP